MNKKSFKKNEKYLIEIENILTFLVTEKLKKREYRIFLFKEDFVVKNSLTLFFRVYKLKPMRLFVECSITIHQEYKYVQISITDNHAKIKENIFLNNINIIKKYGNQKETPFSSTKEYFTVFTFNDISQYYLITNVLLLFEEFFLKIKKENLNKITKEVNNDLNYLEDFRKFLPNYKLNLI